MPIATEASAAFFLNSRARRLDEVPEAAGGLALRIVACEARVTALPRAD